MDDDMQVRGMADRTRETYLWAVSGLAKFYRRSPDRISDAEIQAYLLHVIRERRRSWSTCNIVVQALRFLYHTTLTRDRMTFSVPSPRRPGTLPAIPSRADVERLIAHVVNLRHRTIILTTDAAGLRLSEVLHLRVTDIDAARMTIRVEQGKGGKDRYTVLSRRLLAALRAYWPVARPTPWLFPSHASAAPDGSVRAATGLSDGQAPGGHWGIHGLRHAFATHLLEGGVDIHHPAVARARAHQYDDAVLSADPAYGDGARLAARSARAVRDPATGLTRVRRAPRHGGRPRSAAGAGRHRACAWRSVSMYASAGAGPAPGASGDRHLSHRRAWRASGDV